MFNKCEITVGIAGAILIALGAACGGDDSSSGSPVETGGTSGGAAGSTATAGSTSTAGRASTAAGSGAAGRASTAAGSGSAGKAATAGTSGSAGAAGAADSGDDAGVPEAGSGAAGAAGNAGAAGAAGAAGSAAGAGGAAAGAGGTGTGAGATFTEVYSIIMTSCSGGGCHVPGSAGGLTMPDKATAYTNLVGVTSTSCSTLKRVTAGDPANSVLVAAVAHVQAGSCARTPRMPEGKPQLSADNIEKFRSWVMAGAKND